MHISLVSNLKCTIVQHDGVSNADKSILSQISINDFTIDHTDENLRLVQAFQFANKHGEVCPADWNPESDTIKPYVQKSKEYFYKQK